LDGGLPFRTVVHKQASIMGSILPIVHAEAFGLARVLPFVLLLGLKAISASAHPACDVILPELADDVQGFGLPKSDTRWAAANRLWNESDDAVIRSVRDMVRQGSISPAADIIQGRTSDLLREAISQGQNDLARSLLRLWRTGLDALRLRDTVKIYYATPDQRLSEVTLSHPSEMWVGPNGIETVLYAAIYLAGATDIVAAIAKLPASQRAGELTEFARRVADASLSHYNRWAFGPPKMWQVRGWGCDGSGMDLVEFTTRRINGSLTSNRVAYCAAPTDLDMLLAIGLANLLTAATLAPELVDIEPADKNRLLSVLRLLDRFLVSHITFSTVQDVGGGLVETADLDPGAWAAHPDQAFSGEESSTFPTVRPPLNPHVSWDFSHGARIGWLALTLADSYQLLDGKSDWKRVVRGVAHEIGQKVLDRSAAIPLFRNYLDGSNGWYRVDLDQGRGIPPYGLSRAFLSMPWARLAPHDFRLKKAAVNMWRILAQPSPVQRELLERIYATES
jgi:hypothetical protein